MVLLSKSLLIQSAHVAGALIMQDSEEHYHQYRDKRCFDRSEKESALPLTIIDLSLDVFGTLLLDGAAEGDTGTEDFLDSAGELLGEGLVGISHGLSDLEDLIEGKVTVVLNVLDLLSVSAGSLHGLNELRGSGGEHCYGTLSVLDGDLN